MRGPKVLLLAHLNIIDLTAKNTKKIKNQKLKKNQDRKF